MSDEGTIALRTFPTDDATFAAFAAEMRAVAGDDPRALQAALRRRYPAAVVRPRTDLASPEGSSPLWYAFRHGSVVPPDDHWWEQPGQARAVIATDRTFLAANATLASIVEVPVETIVGARIEDFANAADPSVADDIRAVWDRLLAEGELHLTFRFNRLDGSPRELEIHLVRDGDGQGRHVALVREAASSDELAAEV